MQPRGFLAHLAAVREALETIREHTANIRGDWSDPRYDCREIQDARLRAATVLSGLEAEWENTVRLTREEAVMVQERARQVAFILSEGIYREKLTTAGLWLGEPVAILANEVEALLAARLSEQEPAVPGNSTTIESESSQGPGA